MPDLPQPSAPTANGTGGAHGDGLPSVVELRIHGVSGTQVEQTLHDAAPRQVSGDEVARVWRRSSPLDDQHGCRRDLEAIHWGAFTKVTTRRLL